MIGETSDCINALNEAAAAFVSVGQTDLAITCLERYDKLAKAAGQPQQFQARIAEIRGMKKS